MDCKELIVEEKMQKKIDIKAILKKLNISRFIFILLFFLGCYIVSELLNGNEVLFVKLCSFSVPFEEKKIYFKTMWDDVFKFQKFFVNYFLLIFIYWIIYGLTNRTKLSCALILCCTFIFGVVNYFVTRLRGISITISDIYSIQTAMNVAKGMQVTIEGNFKVACLLFVFLMFMLFKGWKLREKREARTTLIKNITIAVGVIGILTLCVPDYFTKEVELWNINRAYANSGAGLTIVRMVKNLKVSKPKGYNINDVKDILKQFPDDVDIVENTEGFPNVIVIMNESFSDLALAYDMELAEDPIAYFHEIVNGDNVVSGVMHSSQFGGGTANVEYECLTQNATAFLPTGSMPYQQYITRNVKQSMVNYMNRLGYTTYGMHSWDKSGYSREKNYKLLGFEHSMFKDSMQNLRTDHGEYPSDQSTYEVYYDIMNNKEKGEKNFSFIVTMQNHMPYGTYVEEDGIQFLPDNDDGISYFQSEYKADKALKELIEYLEDYDEDTIVLFFGDHQPNINQQSLYELTGDYDEAKANHVVPFFIWANYEIDTEHDVEISPNYFESLLVQVAKLPRDSYTKYMIELRKEIPVITNNYYIDCDGNTYLVNDTSSPYYEKMQEYWNLIYYNMFDNK